MSPCSRTTCLWLILALLIALAQIGCSDDDDDNPTGPTDTGVIWPLEIGNRWVYEIYDFTGPSPVTSSDSIVVTGADTVGGEVRYAINGVDTMVNRSSGLWFKPQASTDYYLLFKYPASAGESWASGPAGLQTCGLQATSVNVSAPVDDFTCYRYMRQYAPPNQLNQDLLYVKLNFGLVREESYRDGIASVQIVRSLVDYTVGGVSP